MGPVRRLPAAPLLLIVLAAWMRLPNSAAARRLAQAGPAAAPPAAQPTPGSQDDAALLLAFKASLENGDEILTDWRPGTDPCAWLGISCNPNGSVNSLVLLDKGIRGNMPQPDGWKLPATIVDISLGNNNQPPTNIVLIGNQLTGGIPEEWTKLPSLAIMSLQNNKLSGPLPSSMMFNQSFGINALSINENNFSGPVPSWPDQPNSILTIHPGNEGLCGTIPKSPILQEGAVGVNVPVNSLPPCPGDPTNDSSGLSGGAIAGIVIGCVAAGVVTLVGAAWLLRRRRQQAATMDGGASKQGSGPMSLDSLTSGKWITPPSSGLPHHQSGGAAQVPSSPFNPFAGGPKVRSPTPTSCGSGGSSGHRTVPLTALRTNSGGPSSATPAAQQAKIQAKLEALYDEKPAWLISPTRLSLEQGQDGQFVLLGAGAYGRVYKGYLQPEPAAATPQPADAQQPAGDGSEAGSSATAHAIGQALISKSGAAQPLPVAIKVMDAVNVSAFLQEASIMTRLAGGPHVVALHGACVDDQSLVVVMELLEGGDLRTLLSSEEAPQWGSGGRAIALDIAEGLVFLHAKNITHRCARWRPVGCGRSKNVLMTKEGRAKISDVGTAALHSATLLSAGSSNFGGTLAWSAPELLLGSHISHRSDVYSMGVVLWELVTKRIPRRGDVAPPPPSDDCPAGLSELIGDCLQLEPEKRPNAEQVLERLKAL
ncbi:hypothetical protein COHA_010196 [Chlorella ohadii]|uniref:Protein kinase domain-containing protein n=1 Tax=Chlorella ohadii TaxID=2649997 RepID=A0AAD5DFT8_9CHLO|nr:hypothetical protein COHA_010196 [Chlorella ohadii]